MNKQPTQEWELPESWCWARAADIADIVGGGTPSTGDSGNFGGTIPWLTPADLSTHEGKFVSGGARTLTQSGLDGSGARLLPKGTVLFSSRAPIGYVAIASQPVATNQGFKSFVPAVGVDSEFLYYWLSSSKARAEALASGTTFLELSGAKAGLLPVPLAPRAEQTRIVAKLEELLSDLDAGVAELKAAQAKLARYRQSLLKAAVSGELTAAWRREPPATETGAELLARILRERRARWERQQRARHAAQGKPLPKNWQNKYPEPAPPDTTDLPELPQGWVWASVAQVAELINGHTPKSAEECASPDGEVPWFKVGDMNRPGNETWLSVAQTNFSREVARDIGMKLAPAGTIVFPKRGGAIATNKKRRLAREACFDLNTMGLAPQQGVGEWLWWWFLSVDLSRLADGSNVPQINNPDIAPLIIPLPPVAEQEAIVAMLDQSFWAAREQDSAITHALAQAAAQRQNILRAAFAGELVAQDPRDEPASALLARIRAERAGRVQEGKRSRVRKEFA